MISVDREVIISSRAFEVRTPSFMAVMVLVENRVGITNFSAQLDTDPELNCRIANIIRDLICITYVCNGTDEFGVLVLLGLVSESLPL